MNPLVYLPVPVVPCGDPGNVDKWKNFFQQVDTLLNDVNFYRVLVYCTAAHTNCVAASPGSDSQARVGNQKATVYEPCSQYVIDGILVPTMSQGCIDCVFSGKCAQYKPDMSRIACILRPFVYLGNTEIDMNKSISTHLPCGNQVINDQTVRALLKAILENCCDYYDPAKFAKLDVSQLLTSIRNTLDAWKKKFPFPSCKAAEDRSFWQRYRVIIIIFIVLASLALAVLLLVSRRSRVLLPPTKHPSPTWVEMTKLGGDSPDMSAFERSPLTLTRGPLGDVDVSVPLTG